MLHRVYIDAEFLLHVCIMDLVITYLKGISLFVLCLNPFFSFHPQDRILLVSRTIPSFVYHSEDS